ncbi:MAG TPA: class I SAM-dependent rRNA methyltransferase [Patescibacteria group bacterium]|nr:class I SAM-dependent rRNA methyltransferase [Patescibacteria group bacterium]
MLRLKRGHDRARVHPWIFKGDVADVSDRVEPGGVVTVVDAGGRFVGRGLFNPRPALCCRLLTWTDEAIDAEFWRRRLAAAVAARARRAGAARLVWSEADALAGLVVDRYGPVAVLQTVTLGMARRRAELAAALRAAIGDVAVFCVDDPTAATLEGFEPAAGWLDAPGPTSPGPSSVTVEEGAARFLVRVGGGHKTGLYLDQADNRGRVAPFGAGRAVLDVFAYTAGFACHALLAGATSAVCVESSKDALAGAVDNLALNGVAARAEIRDANAFDELRRLDRAGARFGFVVLDPPPFARGRGALEGALRGYKEINLRAIRLLEPGGVLATFSCSHHVSEGAFEAMVRDAAADAGVRLRVLAPLTQSDDHPVLLTVPETRYLKGLLLERM